MDEVWWPGGDVSNLAHIVELSVAKRYEKAQNTSWSHLAHKRGNADIIREGPTKLEHPQSVVPRSESVDR